MEAHVHGVSTLSVDDLVKALGSDTGTSKSEASRIFTGLDEARGVTHPATRSHPVPLPDPRRHLRQGPVDHRIVSQAVVIATGVIATGVTEDGGSEVLGVMVGDSETQDFWTPFLRHPRERGPTGVHLVISDSHTGPVRAIRKVMIGAARALVPSV
ncbi:transposase [Streptomyces sp. NPDC016734]|uniref:transposase n=1 Tax=Streptomyces sp. NPDC016734 TaxID=3364971 RepID=UPI00379836EE